MADYYGIGFPSPNKLNPQVDFKGANVRATPVAFTSTAFLTTADRVLLQRLPSNARLTDVGKITYGAFTGASVNIGLVHSKMTPAEVTAAAAKLWAAQSIAAAGSRSAMVSVPLADLNKRLWQLAGLTKDPGGEFDIVMVPTVNATANASLAGDITYITD